MKNTNKIGIIGDMHIKERLGYADYIKDGREKEKEDVLNFIKEQFSDCDSIVFMGDNFNYKNNQSSVIREFTKFVESFGEKEIYIIAGNHEKFGDGKSAIDYLKEVNKKNWHVITDKIKTIGDMSFVPYMFNSELGVEENSDGIKKILKELDGGRILFAHHSISGTFVNPSMPVDLLSEIILPRDVLEKKYKLIVAGHIHTPQEVDNTIITGSVFSNEAGDLDKFIWKIDKDNNVEKILLPGRNIYSLKNPSTKDLEKIDENNIVKIIFDDVKFKDEIDNIKDTLKRFDAYVLLEQYPTERKKVHFDDGFMSFKIEDLLKIYAKEKNIDPNKLIKGFELIN